jgi:hypothetical protein
MVNKQINKLAGVLHSDKPLGKQLSKFPSKRLKKHQARQQSFVPSGSQKGLIKGNFLLIEPIFQHLLPVSITGELITDFITCVVTSHNSYIKNLGIQFGTKYWKEITNYCIQLCEGRKPKPVNRLSTGKVDLWPNKLGALRPLFHLISKQDETLEDRAICLRLLMTLFKLNKVSSDFREIDTVGITQKFALHQDLLNDFDKYLTVRFPTSEESRLNNRLSLKTDTFTFGPSNGPNGVPKANSAGHEASAILSGSLGKPFTDFCRMTDNLSLLTYMEYYSNENNDKIKDGKGVLQGKTILRKLTAIADNGNKSRTVAICDFWTQTLLSSLEEVEKKFLLSNFRKHSAFLSHSKGWNSVLERMDKNWLSLDATAWTDNFPASLQHIYLTNRYGKDLANSWLDLAVKCEWNLGTSDLTVKYGKGQGMGTKGSFIIASVVDHIFIEFMMQRHYGEVLDYVKVGDDLVINDPQSKFISLYKDIGVEINESKSKLSTRFGHFCEFVSRNSWCGIDISIVSPKLITESNKQPFYLPCLIKHLDERQLIDYGTIPRIFEKMELPSREKDKIRTLIALYERLTGDTISSKHKIIGSFNPVLEKFLLPELVRSFNLKYKTLEKKLISTEEKTYPFEEKFFNVEFDAGQKFDRYLSQKLTLSEIQLYQFLDNANSKIVKHLHYFSDDGLLELKDTGLNDYELTLCRLLIEQISILDSWINEIKIVDRLASLDSENPRIMLRLLKDLNTLINKVSVKDFIPYHIPNLLPNTMQLVQHLNFKLGLKRDPNDIPVPII